MTANLIDHRSATFRLQRMEDIYEQGQGQTDQPHRHDYYTVLLVLYAVGEHWIDDHRYPFEGEQVFFVSPGQVHQVALRQKPKMCICVYRLQRSRTNQAYYAPTTPHPTFSYLLPPF